MGRRGLAITVCITIAFFVVSYVVPDIHDYVWACDRGPTREGEDGCSYPGIVLMFVPATIWLCGLGWVYRRNLRRRDRRDGAK